MLVIQPWPTLFMVYQLANITFAFQSTFRGNKTLPTSVQLKENQDNIVSMRFVFQNNINLFLI